MAEVMRKKYNPHRVSKHWNVLLNVILGSFTFTCVFPVIFVVIISFTDEQTLALNGYSIFPEKWSLAAYRFIWKAGEQLVQSYWVTIQVTVIGTMISVVIMGLYAYAIFRKEFRYRKFFTFLIFFTMLFNGGLIPTYMVCTQLLRLRNTLWGLILPSSINAFYIFVLRSFYRSSIPESIIDAAKIDGAGEFRTFFQIVFPIAIPGLATIGLFCTLQYWNDWFNALLYIDVASLTPLQTMLHRIETRMEFIVQNSGRLGSGQVQVVLKDIPRDAARMALVTLATVPLAFAYPFFQRYFVQGLTIGAVKE